MFGRDHLFWDNLKGNQGYMLSRNSFQLISKDSEDSRLLTIAVFDHYDTYKTMSGLHFCCDSMGHLHSDLRDGLRNKTRNTVPIY